MAYGIKYQGSVKSADGHTYEVSILKRSWKFAINQIEISSDNVKPNWGQQGDDLHEPIKASSCDLYILDKDRAIQSEIFGADEEMYRMRITQDGAAYWIGQILTDVFEDSLDLALDVTKISAIDGLSKLDDYPLIDADRVSYVRAILDIINYTGLQLNLLTSCNWFTPDIGTSEDPLAKVKVQRSALQGTETEPISLLTALRKLLERFDLQILQRSEVWQVVQTENLRRASYPCFIYDYLGTQVSTGSVTPRAKESATAQVSAREAKGRRSYRLPYKTTTVVYKPLPDSGPIIRNGSFEETGFDTETGLFGPLEWDITSAPAQGLLSEQAKEGVYSISLPTHYVQSLMGSSDVIPPYFIVQGGGPKVTGGRDSLRVRLSVLFQWISGAPNSQQKYLYIKLRVGSYFLQSNEDGEAIWSQVVKPFKIEVPSSAWPGLDWIDLVQVTPTLPGRGGQVELWIYQPVEVYNTPSLVTKEMSGALVDLVGVDLLQAGESENDVLGIQTQSLSVAVPNSKNRNTLELTIGDGPTSLSPSALTIGTNTLTSDWQSGPYASGQSPSGKSMDRLLSETFLQSQKSPIEVHQATYRRKDTRGLILEPFHVLNYDGRLFAMISLSRDLNAATAAGEWVELKAENWDMMTLVTALTQEGAGNTTIGDNNTIGSATYASGFLGSGWKIERDPDTGRYTLTIDNVRVRSTLSAYELLIQQVRGVNGSLWVTPTGKVKKLVRLT
jgi:hypothetical protein